MLQHSSRLIAGIYQVGQIISSGPYLIGYSAYNRNTNDVVGLLMIDLPLAYDPSLVRQILAPLARRRQVQSPHVVRVHDWGVYENKAYIATDPPRGISLRHLADTENIDLARSFDLIKQTTRGVVTLQSMGITDIDLRPQLITVDALGLEDRVQLDDVGLRSLFKKFGYETAQSIHNVGHLDPRYMAPEYIYQGISNYASDVYQLGILFFELITGRPPFVGRTPAETGILQGSNPVPRMFQLKHDTPREFQEIVDRALAKDSRQRYPHAAAFLAALEAIPQSLLRRRGPTISDPLATPGLAIKSAGAQATTEMAHLSQNFPTDAEETLLANKQTLLGTAKQAATSTGETSVYAYLDREKEGETVQRVPIKDAYVIVGRIDPKHGITPEIDLTALDPQATVSRQHARIRFEKTFFYIEDLKSRNKTRLGELVLVPFKPELLQHGDVVHFGSLKMIFRLPGVPDKPAPKKSGVN